MDKLQQLIPQVTQEANDQASDILNLMSTAQQQNKDHIMYTPPAQSKTLHPLVHHTLTTKGYKVEPIDQSSTLAFSPNKCTTYKISL